MCIVYYNVNYNMFMYIYIYIYRERERDIYIYIYALCLPQDPATGRRGVFAAADIEKGDIILRPSYVLM